jgi:DNA (cytosine-5)-methyltransferase 1
MARFISLFSGAGGLDIGFELAGYQCVHASDVDPLAIETLRANQGLALSPGGCRALAGADAIAADVRELRPEHILRPAGLRAGDVPLLVGGPPCQSWSSAGHQLGFDDPRGELMDDYVRLADGLGVRWVVLENVRGLVTARGRDGVPGSALHRIRDQFRRSGFCTSVALLNAADYGVPQRRVRLFIVAYRAGDEPMWPAPTHAKLPAIIGTRPWVTLGECLASIGPPGPDEVIRPTGRLAEQLAALNPGSGVRSPGKAEATRPGGHWGYKQGAFLADLNAPARTVTAGGQQDWIMDPQRGVRRLSPRDCAALQTFPLAWRFAGKRNDHYRLIGNAVPPLLAKQVAMALLTSLRRPEAPGPATLFGDLDMPPLPNALRRAIDYTAKEERRNGESRRQSPPLRRRRVAGPAR